MQLFGPAILEETPICSVSKETSFFATKNAVDSSDSQKQTVVPGTASAAAATVAWTSIG